MNYETPGAHPTNTGVTATNVSFINVFGVVNQSPGSLRCLTSRECYGMSIVNVHLTHTLVAPQVTSPGAFAWTCGGLQAPRWVNVTPVPDTACMPT